MSERAMRDWAKDSKLIERRLVLGKSQTVIYLCAIFKAEKKVLCFKFL